MDQKIDSGARAVTRPWWLAIVTSAIGALWLYGASLLPQTATHAKVGPGLYLTIVGIGLIVLGVLLAIQIAQGERFEPQDSEDAAADQPVSRPALAAALAAGAIPLYTMQRFGFVPTAAMMFALTTFAFGSRRVLLDLAIGAAIGAIAWHGFTLLGVDLGPAQRLPSLVQLLPFQS